MAVINVTADSFYALSRMQSIEQLEARIEQVVAEGAVHFYGAGVPVVQGIGIGVYGYLESYEGREHRFLEVCLAAGGEPHLVGADEAHDEGGLLAFDNSGPLYLPQGGVLRHRGLPPLGG